jgi:hypothetical protein
MILVSCQMKRDAKSVGMRTSLEHGLQVAELRFSMLSAAARDDVGQERGALRGVSGVM